jgi:hypothetical protein
LPAKGDKSQSITKLLQGPDEPFQDFVSCLTQAVGRAVTDREPGTMLIQQLVFENANKYRKEALHSHRRRVSIQEMIRICSDIGAHHSQGVTLAAALKRLSIPLKKSAMVPALLVGSRDILPKNVTGGQDSPLVGLEFARGAVEGDTGQMSVVPRLTLRATPYRNGETPSRAQPGPIKQ